MILDYEEESSDWKILEKTEDENVRKKMAIYDRESRTISHISGDLTFGGETFHNSQRIILLPKQSTMDKQSTEQISTDG